MACGGAPDSRSATGDENRLARHAASSLTFVSARQNAMARQRSSGNRGLARPAKAGYQRRMNRPRSLLAALVAIVLASAALAQDRERVGWVKGVTVRDDPGGRSTVKNKKKYLIKH